MMRMFSRFRSIRTWVIFGFLVLIFFIGNIYLLKPWDSAKDNMSGKSVGLDSLSSRFTDSASKSLEERSKPYEVDNEKGEQNKKPPESENPREDRKTSEVKEDTKEHHPSKLKDTLIAEKTESKGEQEFKYNIAVLVIACNRPTVSRCLDQIFKYKPKSIDIPIVVSQDCGHKETEDVIKSYGNKLTLHKQPDLSDVKDVPDNMGHFMGYYKISRHYKFALTQAFENKKIDSVIIIEDDLDIAPDFFEYFLATRPLLDADKSLWCISAWNDNGKEGFVKGNDLLYRTDFFPGLGWMITREIWNELKDKWPKGFWDDWMRHPIQRKGRACIMPEISRSKTFGKVGVSMGQFFDQYLKFIELNNEFYSFRKTDLTYLLKTNYDRDFIKDVYKKPLVRFDDVISGSVQEETVRIQYESDAHLETMTRQFNLMTDLKAGVPRTAYKGIISFMKDGRRIFLTPYPGWTGYNEN